MDTSLPKDLSAADAADVLHALELPVLLLNESGTIVKVNEAWCALCQQVTPEQLGGYVGQSYAAVCQTMLLEDRQAGLKALHSVLGDTLSSATLPSATYDYFITLNDRPSWFHVILTPIAETGGALVTQTDITEAQQAQRSFEQLLESPMDALLIVDPSGRIERVNTRLEELFGYTQAELLGEGMDKLLPERFRLRHSEHMAHFMADPHARPMGNGLELLAQHRDGHEFRVEISLTPLQLAQGDVQGNVHSNVHENVVVAAIRDVSERHLSEAQVVQLGRVLETSLNEIYLFDAQTLKFSLVNRGARDNLGYTVEELQNLTPLDLKPEFDAESFAALLGPLRSGHREELEFTTLHRRKDGSHYPVEVHLQRYRGDPEVFVAIIADITERIAAEEARRDTDQRMALHVKQTPLAVIEWRLSDRVITAWNSAAERVFGYRADEVIGLRSAELLLVDDDAQMLAMLGGRDEAPGNRHTNRNRTKNGRIILCEWYNTLLTDEMGCTTGGAALALDVTARQRAVEALLSAQDEERVRISRDLHDGVGQALTAINLGLNALLGSPADARVRELKGLVSQTLEDVRRISRDLRPALLDELGLEAAVTQFARMLSERSATDIDVLARLPERLPRREEVTVYRIIQEALTNVVKHAGATQASVVLTARDNRLHLIVEDNGNGFDPAEVSADGVGLAGMRERVELLGGALRLESTPGRGTIISVRLPLQKQATPNAEA